MRLKKPIVAISAVGLLALAACGGSSNSNSPGTTPNTSAGFTSGSDNGGGAGLGTDPNRKAPAAPIAGAQPGGTLTVLKTATITTLDPTEAYYTDSASILSGLVVRSLTQYVYDPDTKAMILVPDLATNLGTHNADFTSWTFTLRSGIKFGNGQPVTPEDIKYGIERSFDRATFPGGANYSNLYFLDGDTYKGPYKSPGVDYKGVVINGMNITIKMSQAFPDMPYWGAFPAISPIPPGSASAPATYKLNPWSTGPYMFKAGSYTPGKALTLVKNPYWKADTDPGRHQYIDQFDFNFNADSSQIDQIILQDSGSGQTTISYNNVLAADYSSFKTQASDRLVTGSNPCTFMAYPDNRKITDVNVRRAIGYAYPYADAWAAGGSIKGVTRVPADNIMPPGIPGRVEYNPLPGHDPGTTDAAKAKALLTAANAMNYKLEFAYETDVPASVAVKNVLVQAFKAAGFDPQPYATTSANYATQVLQNVNWPGNLRSVGWCSDWPSGGSWFPPVFQTTDLKNSGFGSNYAAFSQTSVDDQIKAIEKQPTTEQPKSWNALDKLIQTKYYPVVVTGYGADAMMRGSKVNGFYNDNVFGMPTWKDMWISS